MTRKNKNLYFFYIIQNCCGKIWTEENMTDDRIKQLRDDGCNVKCIALGKKSLSKTCLL